MSRVLIVEDNANLAFGLKINLELEGYDVATAESGTAGIQQSCQPDVDLILLDLMLPDMSGFDVLRALRNEGRSMPVIVLSALLDEINRVTAFRLGADDYVTKPFSLLELFERIRSRLRTWQALKTQSGLLISVTRREVAFNGVPIRLRPMEFDLLCYLVRADGAVVPRSDLLKHVWHTRSDLTTRTVDNTLVSLNRALNGAGILGALRTVPRRGVAWTLGRCLT